MCRFLRAQGTSSKGDDISITFQLWNGKSIRFVPEVTTLKLFKIMDSTSQQRKTLEPDQWPSQC